VGVGGGRWSSLQTFRMVSLQMVLPMLIDVVMYVVYCVTVWLGGGCDV
jgi:sensor domain CHASE-containing protein